MQLDELVNPWVKAALPDCDILGITNDSRAVKEGFAFIAYPGAATDGRRYIQQALALGARAIIYEPESIPDDLSLPCDRPCIALPGLASQLGLLASRFYGEPGKTLRITGVTGTNGKTTIAYQLAQAHSLLHSKTAYIGTIGQGFSDSLQALDNTTPDALRLQALFHDFKSQGATQVCMEVSSHALCQNRVDGVEFKQAIFTNLSHDHLDYHETMQAYAEAKARLFATPNLEWAIVNADDPASATMIAAKTPTARLVRYGFQPEAHVVVKNWSSDLEGTQLALESPWGACEFSIRALGYFNIYNALAIFTSLMVSGYKLAEVASVMTQLRSAPGRMEIVHEKPYVLVDYAHTPDALENVLATLDRVKKARLIVVFGCGGDRDRSKRPLMGRAASQYADRVIITSDNPRSEDPLAIIEEIARGVTQDEHCIKLVDRKEAIHKALALATEDDIVLIAGKGHEDYQQIGREKISFSDQGMVREFYSVDQDLV